MQIEELKTLNKENIKGKDHSECIPPMFEEKVTSQSEQEKSSDEVEELRGSNVQGFLGFRMDILLKNRTTRFSTQ